MDLKALKAPFHAADIEWRVNQSGLTKDGAVWAKVLAYVTNRAIQDRLDDVCGPAGWKNEYTTGPGGGVLCGISILIDGQWVTKWDGAENTQFEAVKGGLSSAMKRAGAQWGIGRYLYKLEEGFAETSRERKPGYAWAKHKKGKDDPGVSYYWAPPALPKWALPEGEEPRTNGAQAPSNAPIVQSQEYRTRFRGPIGQLCNDPRFAIAWPKGPDEFKEWILSNQLQSFESWAEVESCDDEMRLTTLRDLVEAETAKRLAIAESEAKSKRKKGAA